MTWAEYLDQCCLDGPIPMWFEWYEGDLHDAGDNWMRVYMQVDCVHTGQPLTLCSEWPLPEFDQARAVGLLRGAVHWMVMHEADEHLLVRGRQVVDMGKAHVGLPERSGA